MMVRRWLSIFWRAAWSMRASCRRSSSSILRTSRRIVLRSSMNSTSSRSATASVTTCASLLTLSRLSRTAGASSKSFSKNSLIFFCQLGLHFTEHFLVIGAALLHFVGIGFENDAHLIVDAVLKRQFLEQSRMDLLVKSTHCLGLDETARHQFFGDFAGQIAHIFFGKKHDLMRFFVNRKFNTSGPLVGRSSLVVRHLVNPHGHAEATFHRKGLPNDQRLATNDGLRSGA